MDTVVFWNFTVYDLIIAAIVLFIFYFCWKIVKKFFRKDGSGAYAVSVKCFNCGWEGKVSKFARKCPNCNSEV
jgi:hypothetical protein